MVCYTGHFKEPQESSVMDLPSENTHDILKDEIWKELGPLDPNWFDVLTAQVLTDEANGSDPDDLCANQEGNFKTPLDQAAVESQLFSTPKVFRHRRVTSSETEDEQSFTAEQEKETLPWSTRSPYLFRISKEGVSGSRYGFNQSRNQDCLDLLHTPQKSPVSYDRQISESLGAHIHPDISWTSSLNTPPALPSTLILSKPDESPSPAMLSEGEGVVIVRKLFPSLSNASRIGATSPKSNNMLRDQEDADAPEAGQNQESPSSPRSPLNHSDNVWRQKLPDAIEDGEIRSTVASVLDGAESVLSVFFTNSSSALRKVKRDRSKRKQTSSTKDHGCGSTENKAASTEQRTADQEPCRVPSSTHLKSPVRTGDSGTTQWSPLCLSEIPSTSVETSRHNYHNPDQEVENNCSADPQSDSCSTQLVRPSLKISDSGFIKKKRTFVYTVKTPKPLMQEKETPSLKMDSLRGHESDVGMSPKAQEEADYCNIGNKVFNGKNELQRQENVPVRNPPPSVQSSVQDSDMLQLCRAFAEDFSQMSNPGKLAEDAPLKGFSPSACLTALRRAKHHTWQASPLCDGVQSSRRVSSNSHNVSVSERTSDSGFQSAASSALPGLEKPGHSQQWTTPFDSLNEGNEEDIILETDVMLSSDAKESNTSALGRDGEPHTSYLLFSRPKAPVENVNRVNGQVHDRLPEQTQVCLPPVHAAGFKTASNKGIRVSSANLERAKHLFEETERLLSDSPPTWSRDKKEAISVSRGSENNKASAWSLAPSARGKLKDLNCHLTASQKADVTELCTLLEEADSQFEFTQFKTAKPKEDNDVPSQRVDPDFLTGIDFDDSFCSDAGKQHINDEIPSTSDGATSLKTPDVTRKSTDLSSPYEMKKEDSSSQSVSCSSKDFPEGRGFKSAGGNVLRLSKCLSKARALFLDIEEDTVTDANAHKDGEDTNTGDSLHPKEDDWKFTSSSKEFQGCSSNTRHFTGSTDAPRTFENRKMDAATCQRGFQMASGRRISITAEAIKEANAFFKDCDVIVRYDTGEQKTSVETLPASVVRGHATNLSKCKSTHKMKTNLPEDRVQRSPLCTTFTKNIGSSTCMDLSDGDGFRPASGKRVSADAVTTAECLLNDVLTHDDTNIQMKRGTGRLDNQSGGFQTAGGKPVAVSSAALKKAKLLLSECNGDEDKVSVTPKHSKISDYNPPPRNRGFLAASGKPVAFSTEALQRAKTLFDDISLTSDVQAVSCTRKQDNTQRRESGFTTAGGAMVLVSETNLLTAKHLLKEFDDDSISGGTRQAPDGFLQDSVAVNCNDGGSVEKKQPSEGVSEKTGPLKLDNIQQGKVNISDSINGCREFGNMNDGPVAEHEKMLQKHNTVVSAKAPFPHARPCLISKSSSSSYTMPKNIGSPPPGESNNGGTTGPVSAISEAKCLLNESTTSENANKQLKRSEDEPQNVGFRTAGGRGVTVSSAALQRAKSLLSECDEGEDETDGKMSRRDNVKSHKVNSADLTNAATLHANSSVSLHETLPSASWATPKITGEFSGGGFSTASGKRVSVSDDALTKAKSLLSDGASFEDWNKQLKHTEDNVLLQKVGFQTARVKGGNISSAAVQVKSLLGEWDEVEDKTGATPACSKITVHDPPPRGRGFLSASGKPVAFSTDALQKAKALFDGISLSSDVPAVSGLRTSDEEQGTGRLDTHKADGSKSTDVTRIYNVNRVSDKDAPAEGGDLPSRVSLRESHFQNSSFRQGQFAPSRLVNLHGEKKPSLLERETPIRCGDTPKSKRTAECSVVNFQSLNLTGCSETQQRFLAQEALDCTNALLEDESLAGLSMTLESMSPHEHPKSSKRSVEEQNPTGKRLAEDADTSDQPPLKRRLLEEFDRTLDSAGGSTLCPERSSPTGFMKDRRVFKYSVSLRPNITRPDWDGNNSVETRLQKAPQCNTPGDSRSSYSKNPSFVPPFIKNAKTEPQKNNTLKNHTRKLSAFVPPFKKQRTIVEESSPTPHKDEDKHHRLSVSTFKSNAYVPPTKTTQGTTDVTGNKSREESHTVTSVHPTNDEMVTDQTRPVGCGLHGAAAETSRVVDTLNRSQEMVETLQNAELARDMQDMRIRKKRRQTIRPLPGSLFLTKTSGVSKIPLRDAVNGKTPAKYTHKQLYESGVHQHVSDITSETAESFRFTLQQFLQKDALKEDGGVQLADGGWLIPSSDGTAGKEQFYRALCDTPGVDPKLISEEWLYNHYRWIVWKQASMERSFPETMGSLCLTPEQVLLQLKYRYDVEVDHSRRPSLRKITEKDDTAGKTLVLCVCGVVSRGHSAARQRFTDAKTPQSADANVENPCAVVWLTDGWYAIKAQLDDPLTAMLHKGRLAVGGKLIIHGAQLVGSQEACPPLEAPDSLMLKICANSSRPVRWDTKLGFYKDPRPFLLPLSCLYSSGGPVGCVDVVILRSYPIQWMERKPDGGVVFRSVRAEEKEARRYNSHKQKAMEVVFTKIQAEFEKEEKDNNRPQRRRQTVSRQDVASLQDGEELYETLGDDPAAMEAHLSEQQMETLHAYRRTLMEKKQAELQDRYRRALENADEHEGSCRKRDVTPVWRLCIADSSDRTGNIYQLNLWRPSSDLQSVLKEGCRYKVYNVTTSEEKKRSATTAVQLTGTKKTQFQDLQASQEWLSACFQPRVSTNFVHLQNSNFQPLCGEVDLTGCVITTVDAQGPSPAFYLVDGKLNFVKVRCFSSLELSGVADVVKPHVLLALSNLQLKGQSIYPTPVVYAGDLSVFSTNPKENHLQESLSQLRNLVQGQANFFLTAEEKLSRLIKADVSISSPDPQHRTPVTSKDHRQDMNTSTTSKQPIRSLGSFTPVSGNLPPANCSTEKDPKTLKRRRALDYLCRIPSPPPLSHVGSVASPSVNKTFNPPRRSGTPSTFKTVKTRAHKPVVSLVEDEWVNDEELAMIDTQALRFGDLM